MKLSEIMGINLNADFYDYGDHMVKLFHMNHSHAAVDREFRNINLIHQCFNYTLKALETIELDGQYGIVFEKVKGESLLRIMEHDLDKIEEFAKLFAQIHQKMHQCHLESLMTQEVYFKSYIEAADLDHDIKLDLKAFLKEETQYNSLCHGNFQPDKIIIDQERHYVIDFDNAYQGHYLSDIAKTILILTSPRVPAGTTAFLKEQIKVSRNAFLEIYKKSYKTDDNKLDQYMRLAAITRLNDHIESEKEWLLSIINEA